MLNIKDFNEKVILKDNFTSKKERYDNHTNLINNLSIYSDRYFKELSPDLFKNPFKLEEFWNSCGNNIEVANVLEKLNYHFELEDKRWVFFDKYLNGVLIGKEYIQREVFVGDTVGFIPNHYMKFEDLDIDSEFIVVRGSNGRDYKGKDVKRNLFFEDIFIKDSKGEEHFVSAYEEIMKIRKRKK